MEKKTIDLHKKIKRLKAWKDFKDILLLLILLNFLINNLKQINLEIFYEATPAVMVYKANATLPEKVEREISDQPQDSLVGEFSVKDITKKVYQLESSGGKNDSCKTSGKFNGYGYAQNKFTWNCFDSQEEVDLLVENWFNKNLKDKTLAEALCYYNAGEITNDCEYYEKFKALAG
jgi:hypothetical protein